MIDFFDTNIRIINLLLAINVVKGTGDIMHSNRPSYGLAYNTEGVKVYNFSDGKRFSVGKDSIIFLTKGSNYTVDTKVPGDCYAVNFEIAVSEQMIPFTITPKNPSEILKLFKRAELLWRTRPPAYYEKCCKDLYGIIAEIKSLQHLLYLPKSKANEIAPAIKYIGENYTDKLSVPYLAEMCGVSEVYFRKIFKSIYGLSPTEYVIRLRMERAKELIASGIYSLSKVAEMSGFFDYSYFSRRFKAENSISPNDFSRTKQGNN